MCKTNPETLAMATAPSSRLGVISNEVGGEEGQCLGWGIDP